MTIAEKILSDSRKLFMRYGIKSVTMDDLARHLGISKKTLYQHVSNKEDLLNKVLQEHAKEESDIASKILSQSTDAIDEMVKIAHYVIRQLKDLSPNAIYDLQKYYSQSYQVWEGFHKKVVFAIIKNNLNRGIKEGLYRKEINSEFISKVYIEMTKLLVDEVKFPLFDKHFDRLYGQFITYHLRGIVSDKGFKQLNAHLKNMPNG